MILLLFLYDPLYASSHDLESDYSWSGLKDENSIDRIQWTQNTVKQKHENLIASLRVCEEITSHSQELSRPSQ